MEVIEIGTVRGELEKHNWKKVWQAIAKHAKTDNIRFELLYWLYEESSHSIEIYPSTIGGIGEPEYCFELSLAYDPFATTDDSSLTLAVQEFENELCKRIAKSWKLIPDDLVKKLKSSTLANKLGIYFSPEHPVRDSFLFFICGNKVLAKREPDLKSQIQSVCDKFDIHEDYFTGMVAKPKTFYLTKGEVFRNSFVTEISKLAKLMLGVPNLKIGPEVQLPSKTEAKVRELFNVKRMTDKECDRYLEKIQTKILEQY